MRHRQPGIQKVKFHCWSIKQGLFRTQCFAGVSFRRHHEFGIHFRSTWNTERF